MTKLWMSQVVVSQSQGLGITHGEKKTGTVSKLQKWGPSFDLAQAQIVGKENWTFQKCKVGLTKTEIFPSPGFQGLLATNVKPVSKVTMSMIEEQSQEAQGR
ncbi:hypothetical protein E2542_SST10609 [Spatholobus suberectus]|nr:hypothetical protein E2542_SST10609 [Spatholobus suberectus]